MRGILNVAPVGKRKGGIIPAHAGHTASIDSPTIVRRDHPRTCGAYFFCFGIIAFFTGSSPHMRGIHDVPGNRHRPLGIIPAHAGHTDFHEWQPFSLRDHPRTCGAYLIARPHANSPAGSSPHMRGIRAYDAFSLCCDGIIPAHAGHTYRHTLESNLARDHPRTCGAYQRLIATDFCMTGSSPHMRGIPHRPRRACLG